MTILRTTTAQRRVSTVVLVVAAAAMVATSPEINRISADESGSFELGPNERTSQLTITVTANSRVIETTSAPIPWRASFNYNLQTTAMTSPDVRVKFEPLPKDSGPVEDPIVDTDLPTHPEPCIEGEVCEREYLVTFRKLQPRDGSVSIDWGASAYVDWGDQDVPAGVDLKVVVQDMKESEAPVTPAMAEGLSADLHTESLEPGDFFPLRFEKPAGVEAAPKAIRVSSIAVGGQTTRGRLLLIPEDERDPTPEVGIGRITFFNPFERCPKHQTCVVGYSLELHMARRQRGLGLDTGVFLSPRQRGLEIHRGGVIFESVPAQVDRVLEGSSDIGRGYNWETSIVHADRIPEGTEIEVEGLVEAKLTGPFPGERIEVEIRYGEAVLTADDREDSATGVFLRRCMHPCTTSIAPDLSLGAVSVWFASISRESTEVEYRVTVRLRLVGLDEVPEGVDLELRKV